VENAGDVAIGEAMSRYQYQQEQPTPTASPADYERRRKWAERIDLVWSEMQTEPDFSEKWRIMCSTQTTYEMCVRLDQMAEGRWGQDWITTRAVERKIALDAISKANRMVNWGVKG
jgi:hypothetical protein